MGTRRVWRVFAFVFFTIACSKDDGANPIKPEVIEKPDPEAVNQAPNSFQLLTPEAGEEDVSRTPTLTWEAANDPDGDTLAYDVYLEKGNTVAELVASNLSTTEYLVPEDLILNETYSWKIVAKDGNLETESSVYSFEVAYPIVFLSRYEYEEEGASTETISFSYTNDRLDSFVDEQEDSWLSEFNATSGQLSSLTFEKDMLSKADYNYNSSGFQTLVQETAPPFITKTRDLGYENPTGANIRLESVIYVTMQLGIGNTVEAVFQYENAASLYPYMLEIFFNSQSNDDIFRYTLEWEGNNIKTIVIEIDRLQGAGFEFDQKVKLEYDNSINPYYTIIKEQFGFSHFFVTNISTNLETLNLFPIFWQSENNLTKIEKFNSSSASQPSETGVYEYTYSDNYYPLTARVTSPNDAGFVRNMRWVY